MSLKENTPRGSALQSAPRWKKRTHRSIEQIQHALRRYLSIRSAYSPTFSPDDARLAFITDVTGVPQLWSMDIEDPRAGPEQLTILDDRVGFASYAIGRKMIAYGVDSGGDERFQIQLI